MTTPYRVLLHAYAIEFDQAEGGRVSGGLYATVVVRAASEDAAGPAAAALLGASERFRGRVVNASASPGPVIVPEEVRTLTSEENDPEGIVGGFVFYSGDDEAEQPA